MPIFAPAAGYVLERNITPGRTIAPGQDAFVNGDLSQVWMLASVRQDNLGALRVGQEATVTLTCNREVDAPRTQRILLLLVGVIGALLFTVWPFLPHPVEFGALAWIGGAVAIAVYFLTLRKTSGGIAYDFLQRLARRQRENAAVAAGD